VIKEWISVPPGLPLEVKKQVDAKEVVLTLQLREAMPCLLHWGIASQRSADWTLPPELLWPEGSRQKGEVAVQTPFKEDSEGGRVVLRFSKMKLPRFLVFDLFMPHGAHWENNRGRDFWIPLAEPGPAPSEAIKRLCADKPGDESPHCRTFTLDNRQELATAILRAPGEVRVLLLTNVDGPLVLHWGVQERPRASWKQPSEDTRPQGTTVFDSTAVRSPFEEADGLRCLTLTFPEAAAPRGVGFVMFQPDRESWIKKDGNDLTLRLSEVTPSGEALSGLIAEIVDSEMGPHGWTLMHRFNLCHRLIQEAEEDRDAWAILFVWLRYSAIRQLDWQRNYNTKPRELSHAQDRLTAQLAESYIRHPGQRDLIRGMLGTVGRGGDGQRIRDDILHIMHRHHIKEVGGTWMEQWHQKLHNNTTPDDVVICRAYLAFLYGNGDLAAYDEALGQGGVTRERLAAFERPITQNPEWHPHLKEGLVHDFENYLKLLQSVHSGTDLETASNAGGYLLQGGGREALEFVRHHFHDSQFDPIELTARITEVRRHLATVLTQERDPGRVKDGLYLDLAFEEALRIGIERQLHSGFGGDTLLALIGLVRENLVLVRDDPELAQCGHELARLPEQDRFNPDWALRAKAVVDRLRRAVEAVTDTTYQLLQSKAETLGREFGADQWTIQLFSEEIVRGQPVFVLSMLLHQLDPLLRRSAQLGDWQVISPARAVGEVKVVANVRSVQGLRFPRPTILVADSVHGDEEPPEGVCAIITSKSVDLVSHVAVRARNASLLFATCFDETTFSQLKEWNGRKVELTVASSGDVMMVEGSRGEESSPASRRRVRRFASLPAAALQVLTRSQFNQALVGGKSWRIQQMATLLAGAFRTPRSVALPFGVFEAVLQHKDNLAIRKRIQGLLKKVQDSPEPDLASLRNEIATLTLPATLLSKLCSVLTAEGIAPPDPVDAVCLPIKQVWASLWNDRAYFSRRSNGVSHDSVAMAVLIQELVPAEYAFVIHTVNPANGNAEELYVEVVRGLGETLVGNYPGRAMSFSIHKTTRKVVVVAYPSKSVGLFGGDLIFRSDSNAEDLEGYAGAGLYDSVPLRPPREQFLDYTQDALVWDRGFREHFLDGITELGMAVEQAFGGPQDIEGAWVDNEFHVVQTRPQVGTA
jgi:alpha-glucan,water dikinase